MEEFQLSIEDVMEDIDLKLKQEKMEEKEEEGEPSAKAKTDNSNVPVQLWNDQVANKLSKHWYKEGLRSKRGNSKKELHCQSLDFLCKMFCQWMLKYWKKKVI